MGGPWAFIQKCNPEKCLQLFSTVFHNWSKDTLRLMWKGNCLNTWTYLSNMNSTYSSKTLYKQPRLNHVYIYTNIHCTNAMRYIYIYIHHYISYVCMLVPSRSYTARKGGNFEINQDVVRPTMKSEQSKQRKTMQNL